MMRRICFSVLLLLVTFGCKKPDPSEDFAWAHFIFYGNVDGQKVRVDVGRDDYVMETSFMQDVFGLYTFDGTYTQQNDCEDKCYGDLSIRFFNTHNSSNGASVELDTSSSIAPGFLPLWEGNDSLFQYTANFTAIPFGDNPQSYLWTFGDGDTSTLENPSHTYPVAPEIASYLVCLTIFYGNGCSSTLCNDISLPNKRCQANFEVSKFDIAFFEYQSKSVGLAPLSHHWTSSSGIDSTARDISKNYTETFAIDTVCLEVFDSFGCSSIRCKQVVIDDGIADCATNFNYNMIALTIQDTLAGPKFGLTQVIYTERNGISWYSNKGVQSGESGIQILSVQDYFDNENGHPTKRIEYRLHVTLYNGIETKIIQGYGQTGIAYPD